MENTFAPNSKENVKASKKREELAAKANQRERGKEELERSRAIEARNYTIQVDVIANKRSSSNGNSFSSPKSHIFRR